MLYTGDIIWINKEYHHLFEGLTLIITECSYYRKGGMLRRDKETGQIYGHTGAPNLVDLFKPFTRHILFTHFGNWFYKDTRSARKKLGELAESTGVHILVGYDGMELDLNKYS
jgi:hypothetical protein